MERRSKTTIDDKRGRSLAAGEFLLGALWMLACFNLTPHLAGDISSAYARLFQGILTIVFLLIGFAFLSRVFDRKVHPLRSMGLMQRRTAPSEWGLGLAIGWGAAAALILPMTIAGAIHPSFHWSASSWNWTLTSVISLVIWALAEEIGFRGYPFQRLVDAVGEGWATTATVAVFGLVHLRSGDSTFASTLATVLGVLLFSIAYLRTRALWLSWGLHFGWNVSLAVLFGLPLEGKGDFSSVIQSDVSGPKWLTGSTYGPEASFLAPIVLLIALVVLIRCTREYAWEYRFVPPIGSGYPMDAPPPPEHAAMEASAKPAPLVQIVSLPQRSVSADPKEPQS